MGWLLVLAVLLLAAAAVPCVRSRLRRRRRERERAELIAQAMPRHEINRRQLAQAIDEQRARATRELDRRRADR